MEKKLIPPEYIKEFKELGELEKTCRSEPTVRLEGMVVTARYHIGKGIAVLVKTEQGHRAAVLPYSLFLFKGQPYGRAPAALVHREMEKLAETIRERAAQGTFPASLLAFESQVTIQS